jgi:hypothetical protein
MIVSRVTLSRRRNTGEFPNYSHQDRVEGTNGSPEVFEKNSPSPQLGKPSVKFQRRPPDSLEVPIIRKRRRIQVVRNDPESGERHRALHSFHCNGVAFHVHSIGTGFIVEPLPILPREHGIADSHETSDAEVLVLPAARNGDLLHKWKMTSHNARGIMVRYGLR